MGAHQDMPSSSITSFVGSSVSAREGAHQDLSSIVEDSLLLNRNHPAHMGVHRDVFGSVQAVSTRTHPCIRSASAEE
jgi:hypothetical protein